MKFKCPHCGTVMGCIECAGYLCDGCGSDLSKEVPKSDTPVMCNFDYTKPIYTPVDNDNDTEEMWDE